MLTLALASSTLLRFWTEGADLTSTMDAAAVAGSQGLYKASGKGRSHGSRHASHSRQHSHEGGAGGTGGEGGMGGDGGGSGGGKHWYTDVGISHIHGFVVVQLWGVERMSQPYTRVSSAAAASK